MSILAEYGSGDDFHRWVHEFENGEYDKRLPGILEVANWGWNPDEGVDGG